MNVSPNVRRVVVITGAGGTLGAALSRQFASEPDTDVVLSDASAPSLDATVNGLSEPRGAVETVIADVGEISDVEAVVARAVERFGRLDVLISNAGVLAPNGRIHNLSTEDWERTLRVNVLGGVNNIRAAVPVMRAQQSGSIILTASVAGLTAWSHAAPYCATKAAVIQLAKVAAVEYARDGIRVNCVCPGTFLSGIHAELPEEAIDAIAAKHPLGLGSADDLVGAYSYLASDAARWTTGSAIVVDGGYAGAVGVSMDSDMSWLGVLEHHALRTPDKPLAVFGDDVVTYQGMVDWAAAVAGGLQARGVGAGDVVGLLSYNSIEFLATIFAANHLGAIAMPINWRLAAAELRFILEHSEARALVCDETCLALANEATNDLAGDLVRVCTAVGKHAGWERFCDLGAESAPPDPCARSR